MEKDHQEVEQFDKQSINTTAESSNASSTATNPSSNDMGGGSTGGEEPIGFEQRLKQQSENSIQAKEAAHWQMLANTSKQAQENRHLKPIQTGIPKNIQGWAEYMTGISLRDVRVYYNSEKATAAGKGILNEYPNIYIATGQEEQLSTVVWNIAQKLKKEKNASKEQSKTAEATTTQGEQVEENKTVEPTNEAQQTETMPPIAEQEQQASEAAPVIEEENAEKEAVENTKEEATPINRLPASSSKQTVAPIPSATTKPKVQQGTTKEIEPQIQNTPSSPKVVQPTPSPLPSPEQDPDFQAVTEQVATQGDKEQRHQSASHEAQEAQKAAVEPANRRQSLAEAQQVDTMEAQETPAFDVQAFIDNVMRRVQDIMPQNEKEADEFESSGRITQVQNAVTNNVSNAQDESVGPLEQATQEQPSTAGIASRQVSPLGKADIGRAPSDIGADRAVPNPLNEDRVEQPLQSNAQEVEQQMASNNITEEQLSKSNEPTFIAALDASNTAQQDSEQAATTLRTEEQQSIAQQQNEAATLGEQEMGLMHNERAVIMGGVHGEQETTSRNYTAAEQKVSDKISNIYKATKTKVEGRLSSLDARVQQLFESGASDAQNRFERYVKQKMDAYKAERYEGVSGAFRWVGDAFTGLPEEVNAFFVEGRDEYIRAMENVIRKIATIVAQELTAAKEEVQAGRQEVANYVESLPDDLQKVGQQAALDINRQFDELNSQIDAKQEELIEGLAQKYKEKVEQIDNRIEELKAANRGLIDIALDAVEGVIGTILEIKAALTGILNAAIDAIGAILSDPIGFLQNVIEGVGQGITGFMGKIQEYLTEGFVDWLTGTMSGIGLELPEDIFSLEGIFSLTTQVLGLTWDFIRERAVKILGERAVRTIEEGFEIFQIIQTEGIAGAWEYLKEQFNDLKETIMDSMIGMIISEVVEAGLQSILSLLTPAGAFVKAAMMIVDVAKFFINQGSQIIELVKAFTASISAIAAGNVSKVAQSIEQALAMSIPVLIGFFTSLLGIGDLVGKVQKIFHKITDRITGAIDGFIEKAGAWFKDKKGRRKERREQRKAEQEEGKEESNSEDKQQAEKGIRLGTAIVKNEELTEAEIKVELGKLERKEGLKELDADVVSKTEEWHTFMLEAKEGSERKTKEIRRKPTKATNEEEVSEADRALHKRIADEVKRKLEAKGESTEGVETFEAFYAMIREEAVKLQKEYQPQLRNGIKIAVDLVNSVQKDKQDGDVDVRVEIAPNTMEEILAIVAAMDLDEALNHIKYRELDAARKKGIVGCHDMIEFNKIRQETEPYLIEAGKTVDQVPEIIINSKVEHSSIPGVYLITYSIPAIDGKSSNPKGFTTGELKEIKCPKTVYDPKIWTDDMLLQYVKEAIADAFDKTTKTLPREWSGATKKGYRMRGYFVDNKITSFFFE